MINYFSNGKAVIICVIVGLINKISLYKLIYFPEPYSHIKNKINVELYLCNYATKSDFKGASGIDTSEFAKKVNLASLISDVHDFDIS